MKNKPTLICEHCHKPVTKKHPLQRYSNFSKWCFKCLSVLEREYLQLLRKHNDG